MKILWNIYHEDNQKLSKIIDQAENSYISEYCTNQNTTSLVWRQSKFILVIYLDYEVQQSLKILIMWLKVDMGLHVFRFNKPEIHNINEIFRAIWYLQSIAYHAIISIHAYVIDCNRIPVGHGLISDQLDKTLVGALLPLPLCNQ